MIDSHFFVEHANRAATLKALLSWSVPAATKLFGPDDGMLDDFRSPGATLSSVLSLWGWGVTEDVNGTVVDLRWKAGDDEPSDLGTQDEMMAVLAPFVRHGNYLYLASVYHGLFGWHFSNGRARRVRLAYVPFEENEPNPYEELRGQPAAAIAAGIELVQAHRVKFERLAADSTQPMTVPNEEARAATAQAAHCLGVIERVLRSLVNQPRRIG